jgi:hypothetical protein
MPTDDDRKSIRRLALYAEFLFENLRRLSGGHSAVWTIFGLDIRRLTQFLIDFEEMPSLFAKLKRRRRFAEVV